MKTRLMCMGPRERPTLELSWAYTYNGRYRVARQDLLQCVNPAPESQFSDVPDLDVYTAINPAMNRVEGK